MLRIVQGDNVNDIHMIYMCPCDLLWLDPTESMGESVPYIQHTPGLRMQQLFMIWIRDVVFK